MDRRRLRFYLASTLFAGWVCALGTLAWLSGEKPQVRASAPSLVDDRPIPGPKAEASMAWAWTPDRRDSPELMDAPGLPEDEVEDAYRVLRRVNKQLGNLRTMRKEFRRFVLEDVPGRMPFTLLDVGSGSGDIAVALRAILPERADPVLALDRDPLAVASARSRSLAAVRGDALRLPFADHSIDLVTAIKFAHHFQGRSLGRLIEEMARVARHRVIVLDIRRHWLAYWGFRAWSLALTRNRLVRHDGPLSVLRGFTPDELMAPVAPLLGWNWVIRPYLGFQLALVGQRESPIPG